MRFLGFSSESCLNESMSPRRAVVIASSVYSTSGLTRRYLSGMEWTRRSFEVHELVIAGIAEMPEQPDPLGRAEKRLARERPALEVEQLFFVPVALHHEVLVA